MVLYEKYLISMFMHINEKLSNASKNLKKIKGCTYKITNVSPTISHLNIHELHGSLINEGKSCKNYKPRGGV